MEDINQDEDTGVFLEMTMIAHDNEHGAHSNVSPLEESIAMTCLDEATFQEQIKARCGGVLLECLQKKSNSNL